MKRDWAFLFSLPPTVGPSPPERKWPACQNRNQAMSTQQDNTNFVCILTHIQMPMQCALSVCQQLSQVLLFQEIFWLTSLEGLCDPVGRYLYLYYNRHKYEWKENAKMKMWSFTIWGNASSSVQAVDTIQFIHLVNLQLCQILINGSECKLLLQLQFLPHPFFLRLFTPPLSPSYANLFTAHNKYTYSAILSSTVTQRSLLLQHFSYFQNSVSRRQHFLIL